MSLHLLRPQTAFVEPVGNSGLTDSGIYVYDHDETKDMQGQRTTMMYRVTAFDARPEAGKSTGADITPGSVYLVQNPYGFTEINHNSDRKLVMHASNFVAEIEGYDAACYQVEPELSDSPDLYQVCTK